MAERFEIFRCNICGHIIEVLREGAGELVCCNQPMEKLQPKTEDTGQEKHVPVIEKTDDGVRVRVGSIPHPMEQEHHIEWIQVIADGKSQRKFLNPGDEPVAEFCVKADSVVARESCNLHGLWCQNNSL